MGTFEGHNGAIWSCDMTCEWAGGQGAGCVWAGTPVLSALTLALMHGRVPQVTLRLCTQSHGTPDRLHPLPSPPSKHAPPPPQGSRTACSPRLRTSRCASGT